MSDELAEISAQLLAVQSRLSELDQLVTELLAERTPPGQRLGADDQSKSLYATVHDWVRHHFALAYARHLGIGSRWRWCDQWYQHPEALIRLEALWRTWETARFDPSGTAMASWLRDQLDHQLPILLSEDGPFHACKPGAHEQPTAMPVIAV